MLLIPMNTRTLIVHCCLDTLQVLIPTKEQLAKISRMAESRKEVLYEARARADWARHEKRERKRELDALERERGMCYSTQYGSRIRIKRVINDNE